MKFYELDSTRYNRYLYVVNDFEKKNNIKNSGVLLIAIEGLPEIHSKLMNLDSHLYSFNDLEKYNILKEYNEINYAYNNYFNQIFERCCAYESVKSDLNFYLGSIYKWTEVVLGISENIYNEYYEKTKLLNPTECEKVYSEIIKLGNQTIIDILDRIYRSNLR